MSGTGPTRTTRPAAAPQGNASTSTTSNTSRPAASSQTQNMNRASTSANRNAASSGTPSSNRTANTNLPQSQTPNRAAASSQNANANRTGPSNSTGNANRAATSNPASNANRTSATNSAAPNPDAPVDPAEAQAQARRDALMQEHWLKWASFAEEDRSYVLALDKSTPAVMNEVKTILGPGVRSASVPRVRGFFEDIPQGTNLGNVQVAIISASSYEEIQEKFDFQSINVKVGEDRRTAFIPVPIPPN
ncbi:hypothetical protein B0J18DRAFT_485262 [Chaetomium sp. MPI-SDFR-AT-0129]|nr:hypothetical protein B0J18DRAFT_485262 [Chaetomium sp. MPI-SDFR-AT-0129]